MSRFFNERLKSLKEYVPGEQPKVLRYVKLNTNESPFPPSETVKKAVAEEVEKLNLYSDPEVSSLTAAAANYCGVRKENVLMTNGSDEILNFAFAAFGDKGQPFAFPSLTYGFYPVFARLNGVPYREIPLKSDFSVNVEDYLGLNENIVLANPNAPTGLLLSLDEIERIVASNPLRVVVIDEAYIDFGGESAVSLIDRYDNLLVTRTFSKSFSLAGARLGFGIGNELLINDLKKIKYSTNPYNVNRMTAAAGTAALEDAAYYMKNCAVIAENREKYKKELVRRGFTVTDSKANFIFASHGKIGGEKLYKELKSRGVLVRHFAVANAENFIRVTVGTAEQMEKFISAADDVLADIK